MFSPRYRPERWIKILAVPLHYHQEKRLSLQPWDADEWICSQYLNFWHQFLQRRSASSLRSCVMYRYMLNSQRTPPWCCFGCARFSFRNGIESQMQTLLSLRKGCHGKPFLCPMHSADWLRCSQVLGPSSCCQWSAEAPVLLVSASNLCTLQQQLSSHCSCWCWYSNVDGVALHGHCSWLFY